MAEGLNRGSNMDVQARFQSAAICVRKLAGKLSEEQMLLFYGLYKQATEGPCNKPKPSWYQMIDKHKWEAWSRLKQLDADSAMTRYINALNDIKPDWQLQSEDGDDSAESQSWVRHSCLQNNDTELLDCNKTILDWVKEDNAKQAQLMLGEGRGVEVDALDEEGLGLLHWATDRGSLTMVKYLVESCKANINVRDQDGQTPLHFASSCGHEDVLKYLLQAGADTQVLDNEEQSPLSVACDPRIQQVLQQFA